MNIYGDWIQYKDLKSFKVIDTVTEEEALKRCQQLDSSATLISIHSDDEQQFLNDIVVKYSRVSSSAWIGLNYGKDGFVWQDQSETNYTNWSKQAAKSGEVKCVEMSLEKDMIGKWTDVSCKKTALTICQKKQDLSLITIRNALNNLEKGFKDMKETLKAMIPIGFLYTQLPDQSSPDVLWPNMKWTEVTQSYAGLFFRAEGGNSLKFGQLQLAGSPKITTITTYYREKDNEGKINLEVGKESAKIRTGDGNSENYSLSFFTSNEEVKPINKAVKIWKRTG